MVGLVCVSVVMYQGSVLSPSILAVVDVFSESDVGCVVWELLYVDDVGNDE